MAGLGTSGSLSSQPTLVPQARFPIWPLPDPANRANETPGKDSPGRGRSLPPGAPRGPRARTGRPSSRHDRMVPACVLEAHTDRAEIRFQDLPKRHFAGSAPVGGRRW